MLRYGMFVVLFCSIICYFISLLLSGVIILCISLQDSRLVQEPADPSWEADEPHKEEEWHGDGGVNGP